MSTACETTQNSEEVVCSKEKRVELMGVDLQTDPYVFESEGEEDCLFGDVAAAGGGRPPAVTGCPFAPRCPHAVAACAQAPETAIIGLGHRVACHLVISPPTSTEP